MTDANDSPAAEPAPRLADGRAPVTPDALFARLDGLGVTVATHHHPPVFTVEEAKALRGSLPGGHCKSLFLRNKKGRMWLVVCLEDRRVDLKALGEALGGGRLSFASARRLMAHLGVIPGAVTPFAVINDTPGAVQVVLERTMMALSPLNYHPLDNAMTTAIEPADLIRFLTAEGHPPSLIELP